MQDKIVQSNLSVPVSVIHNHSVYFDFLIHKMQNLDYDNQKQWINVNLQVHVN